MERVARNRDQKKEEEMTRQAYDTDLTDKQWALIAAFFPEQRAGKRGRPRTHASPRDRECHFVYSDSRLRVAIVTA